jgi:hypothetical protein
MTNCPLRRFASPEKRKVILITAKKAGNNFDGLNLQLADGHRDERLGTRGVA